MLSPRFQSTHPVWGATTEERLTFTPAGFQSTHPVWGATRKHQRDWIYWADFNPRTPCGVRHLPFWQNAFGKIDFNPRTPCGVRPHIYIYVNRKNKFQSTHPVWGATSHRRSRSCYRPISIHAPRVGCDVPVKRIASFSGSFQSTHPVWGATCDFLDAQAQHSYFNPRTPCGVRHIQLVGTEDNNLISIHAPRVGCDRCRQAFRCRWRNFNPRTPCGVRQRVQRLQIWTV